MSKGSTLTRRSKARLVLLFLLVLTYEVWGQSDGTPQSDAFEPVRFQPKPIDALQAEPKPPSLRTLWSDQKAIWSSPFRMGGEQAVNLALPFVAGTAGLMAADRNATKWLPNTPDQVKWSKRVSQIGDL